jgi:hypothetical protein
LRLAKKKCSRRGTAVVEQPSWRSRRGEAAREWIPYENRTAEAEYFFDERNEEVVYYGQNPVKRLYTSLALVLFEALICAIISWISWKKVVLIFYGAYFLSFISLRSFSSKNSWNIVIQVSFEDNFDLYGKYPLSLKIIMSPANNKEPRSKRGMKADNCFLFDASIQE